MVNVPPVVVLAVLAAAGGPHLAASPADAATRGGAAVTAAAADSEPLRCYACVPNHQIAGVTIPVAIANKTAGFPRCADLRPSQPAAQFQMTCPPGLDSSCIKIRDDSGNEMRSCFSAASQRCTKTTKKGQVLCTCHDSFCNAAIGRAPWAAALSLALAVGLLRPRH